MARWLRLRTSEWVLIAFFTYVCIITPFFELRPRLASQPILFLIAVFALLALCARLETGQHAVILNRIRDWLPIPLTLLAFREMELFLPVYYDYGYERSWIRWDRLLLETWHLRAAVESLGRLLPAYFELCYFLVYGVAPFCVAVLWLCNRRKGVSLFFTIYLTGTLTAYALFPYFPSKPPRLAFPDVAAPTVTSWIRELNLFILSKATIHSGVFPSAHVSSTFAAAFGMLLAFPERKRFGWGLMIYGVSVSIATIYGRYHYTADVLAGIEIGLVAGLLCLVLRSRRAEFVSHLYSVDTRTES